MVYKDFRPPYITTCVLNAFLFYTAIMLNCITIHALRKTTKTFKHTAPNLTLVLVYWGSLCTLRLLSSLMSGNAGKYCSTSTTYLTELFVVFIFLQLWQNFFVRWSNVAPLHGISGHISLDRKCLLYVR